MNVIGVVVEDEALREQVVGQAQRAGGQVACLPDISAAVRHLDRTPYGMVIIQAGLFLPDNLAALERLHETAPYAQIILVVPSDIDREQSMALLRAGASDFVVRSTASTTLVAAISRAERQLVSRKRYTEEQRRYKLVFDSMLDGYALHEIICDDDGTPVDYRFLAINPAFERLTGLGEEIVGRTAREVLPGIESHWIERYGKVALTGEPASFIECSGELHDRWFHVVASSPALGQFVTIFEDVTDRKKTEEALRYQASLLEKVSDSIISSDLDFTIRSWNYAAEEIYGWRAEEVVGRSTDEVLRPDFMTSSAKDVRERFFDTGSWRGEVIHHRKDGTPVHILSSTTLFRDEAGQPIGVVSVNRDITEHRHAREQLRIALGESRQRQAEVSALLKGARAVLEDHEFPQTARSIFDVCKDLLGAQAGYVALLSEDGAENELLFLDAGGLPCTVDPELPMPIRGLRSEAYHTGKAVYENDFFNSGWVSFLPEGHVYMGSVLFAPLAIDGVTTGLLGLANKPGGFTDDDARMATAFGELAAIALRNARTLEMLEQRTRELRERVKELNCLYGISALLEKPDISLGEILQATVDLIPPAWQAPEATCARIVVEGRSYQTPHFEESVWCQTASLMAYGERVGTLDVYLTDGAARSEPIFMPEEDALLRVIAERVGRIVEHMQIEEMLRHSEEKYRTLFEYASDSIFLIDPETRRFLDVNENAARRLGYTRDELLQMTLADLDGTLLEEERQEILDNLSQQGTIIFERVHRRKDGTRMPVEISSRIVEFDGQRVYQSFVRDISERKAMEAQIQEYTHHLEQLVQEKVDQLEEERAKTIQSAKLASLGKMATGVAHEVNQPLTAILFEANYLQSIAARQSEIPRNELWLNIEKIGENLASDVTRIRRITDHLRTFGRISGGYVAHIDIHASIENSFVLIGERFKEQNIDLCVSFEPDLPLILANPNRLEQVFLNLVGNAEYALEEMERRIAAGEVDRPEYRKVLEVSTYRDDNSVVAVVRDNGCGISESDQERLFEPFFTTKPIGQGTGLGLSISYGIVQEMGGEITCSSVENEGTAFTIRFPVAKG